jgi:hypothetical protein
MIGRIIGVLSIPVVAFGLWMVVRQVRRPSRLRGWTPICGLVMAPIGMVLNIVILHQAAPGASGWILGAAGLVFGVAWDRTTRIEWHDDRVIARRSALYVVLWALSYAITQILTALTDARWVSIGLATLCFATGTAIGMNLDLLWRWSRVRKVSSAVTT